MESIEKGKSALIAGIETDARAEAEGIIAEAQKQAQTRRENSDQQVQTICNDAKSKAAEQTKAITKKILSGVDIEIKRIQMRIQDTVLQDIMNRVQEKLRALVKKPQYHQILLNWVVEAAVGLGADAATINASADERTIIDRKFCSAAEKRIQAICGKAVKLRVADTPPLPAQGVVLTAKDGRTAFNNQVPTRIIRSQREIRKMVYEKVFVED